MVNQMRYNSVLSPYMYAYIKEKEAIGHTATQTKWFFHELDIYFQQNSLTSTQITKEMYDGNIYVNTLDKTMKSLKLKPERKNAWEIGLDWRFLRNRMYGRK